MLIAPDRHVGGMVSGGLSWTDVGDTRAVGGLARRFCEAVAEHYDPPLCGVKGAELQVAEQLLATMLDGVDVHMSANYVAREPGHAMHGWGHGDRMTNEAFRPLETYDDPSEDCRAMPAQLREWLA